MGGIFYGFVAVVLVVVTFMTASYQLAIGFHPVGLVKMRIECEKDLPRSQRCIPVYVVEDKS